MGISIEDGIRYVTCDGCDLEIRGEMVNTRTGVFHPDCTTT